MDINTSLLNYTRKVNVYETNVQEDEEQEQLEQTVSSDMNTAILSCIDYVDATNSFSVESIGENLTDEEIVSKVDNLKTTVLELADTEGETSSTDDIKQTIYNLYNNSLAVGYGIKDANSLFRYLHQNYSGLGITKSTGITKNQLVALTQIDSKEDVNHDFFGSLNRIFDELDQGDGDDKGNDKLSYKEIEKFLGSDLMQKSSSGSTETYDTKVVQYADKIEDYYETLDPQEKLEYALNKTEEYLEAKGLTNQLCALNRLTGGKYANDSEYANNYDDQTTAATDRYAEASGCAHVGQIAMGDLDIETKNGRVVSANTGAYASSIRYIDDTSYYNLFGNDYDDSSDLGLTLNQKWFLDSKYGQKWYDLVDTLVHELTHATAYLYTASSDSGVLANDVVERLYNLDAFKDEDEYEYYRDHFEEIAQDWIENGTANEKTRILIERIDNVSGELVAYQTDADYLDSIAADEYDSIDIATQGKDEGEAIKQHLINTGYDLNSASTKTPEYKWTTYC